MPGVLQWREKKNEARGLSRGLRGFAVCFLNAYLLTSVICRISFLPTLTWLCSTALPVASRT
jgi:hypothetical protein